MFIMDKLFHPVLPGRISMILIILAVCLTAHFLVEDILLFASHPGLSAISMSADELMHQDDLVVLASLPELLPADALVFTISAALPAPAQPHFHLLHPPKP